MAYHSMAEFSLVQAILGRREGLGYTVRAECTLVSVAEHVKTTYIGKVAH